MLLCIRKESNLHYLQNANANKSVDGKVMQMKNWENLFEEHILERGYSYYLENAVENLDISADIIKADVIGSEEYEVEISLDDDGEIEEMYCSCPYADGGRNCKHMAAVLYEWENNQREDDPSKKRKEADPERDLFLTAHTKDAYDRKIKAVRKLVEKADIEIVRSYLTSVLMDDEKLLVRFNGIVNRGADEDDVKRYMEQADRIADCYLGRDHFISYHEAGSFISELEDILEEDVRRMIDNGQYRSAFQLADHIFVLVGSVDMDDSDGGAGMLADRVYELWQELLEKADPEVKKEMFQWFTTHLDGSIIDYLEEYIEQIIMDEFSGKEYLQQKLLFAEKMIEKSEKAESGWSRDYNVGKWAKRYLDLLESQKSGRAEIEGFCRKHWRNSSVRKYYIDLCMREKEFDLALQVLDESISMDKEYRGLVVEYSRKKKEIFLLQGDKEAYIGQLWELVLNHEAGNLKIFRELKSQYTEEEWMEKREELFKKLPRYADVQELYREEKLYSRLLDLVMKSPGLYSLQKYTDVLKKDYPEQLLEKYEKEVNQMAALAGNRTKYQEMVRILRSMKKIRGGSKAVEKIVEDWKGRFRNRPAMMDELGKL